MGAASFGIISALSGRRLLVTGSTGFIGKVTLAMLLDRAPGLGQVYVLVRPHPGRPASERFQQMVLESPAFAALRERLGAGLAAFLAARVTVLSGDVTEPDFGLPAPVLDALSGRIDLVVNLAGYVAFNPALDEALEINAHGARRAAELAVKLGARLLHMSTCYVAGLRDGAVREDEALLGYFPKGRKAPGNFSAAAELADCEAAIGNLKARAAGEMTAAFRLRAAKRLADKGRAPTAAALALGVSRQSKRWLEERLVEEGRRRAQAFGWPNIYCFSKALGEQLIAATPGLEFSIARPSVVESSLRYPFPGWNEGLTTSAPVILAMCTGHALWPAHPRASLDVIPVDLAAAGTIAAAAALLSGRGARVYHLGSSDLNPFPVRRIMRYVGQYRRSHYKSHAGGALWAAWLWTRVGVITVSAPFYRRFGVPAFRRAAGRLAKLFSEPPKTLAKMERELAQVEHVVDAFLPFIHDIDCVFKTDNIKALYARLPRSESARFAFDPEGIDWKRYWFDVHTEGLRRWVFPGFPGRNGGPLKPPRGPLLNRAVRGALRLGQRALYGAFFSAKVVGAEHIPDAPGFIVASNHASHLDMGLIKHALGPAGRDLAALAAKDYFFKNPALGYFFRNFTNLLPISRGSGVKDALALACKCIRSGRNLLIFPEASRSTDGELASFKPTVGFLALRNKADVLPAYVAGTHQALPKGRLLPRGRRLVAHLGPVLRYSELREATKHLAEKEAYRAAAALIEEAVRKLERGTARRGARQPVS